MKRPTSVTVFGILNIVFAVIGLFGLVASIVMMKMPASSNNPVVRIMQENQALATWVKISIPLGLLSCGALLAAGIGLLFLKPWARVLSIAYGFYSIAFGILGIVLNFLFLFRPLLEEARQQNGPEAAGAIGGAIGGTFGGCFGLIYPVVLLIFMCRPAIASAFRPPPLPQV